MSQHTEVLVGITVSMLFLAWGCRTGAGEPKAEALEATSNASVATSDSSTVSELYPEGGPPLRPCPNHESATGETCRLTPVPGGERRLLIRFPSTTTAESESFIPPDLIRFRFLGRSEDFLACLIPATREGWTGNAETAIKATLVGSNLAHVTMAPAGLPENATGCFKELTRRLRVAREPGEDARITQPTTILVEPVTSTDTSPR